MSAPAFSKDDLSDIETFAGGVVLNLFTFEDVALCRVGQDKVGVPPGRPQRQAMLEAVQARALATGYTGPAFPTRDPDDALYRQHVLARAMQDVPRDAGWADKLLWIEGQIAGLDLDAPDLGTQVAQLQAAYQPPALAPSATPAAVTHGFAPGVTSEASALCIGGSHAWGEPDDRGWRICTRCQLTNVTQSDNTGPIYQENL